MEQLKERVFLKSLKNTRSVQIEVESGTVLRTDGGKNMCAVGKG